MRPTDVYRANQLLFEDRTCQRRVWFSRSNWPTWFVVVATVTALCVCVWQAI